MLSEKEKVTLKFADKKKHSVRFDNKQSDVLKSFYLMNDAYRRLGRPTTIYIELSSVALVHQEEPDES